MNENIYLIGAEQVQSAGIMIRDAADKMQQSVNSLSDMLYRHERFMEDWLERLNQASGGPRKMESDGH